VEPLLGNELIYIDSDGTLMDKGRYMASVKSSTLHAEQVTSESMKVRVYGASAVVVGVYPERGTKHGKRICIASASSILGSIAAVRGSAWRANRR
jgi:hypothetical protein